MLAHDIEGRAVTAPLEPKTLHVSHITFAAILTAVPCARVFTRYMLHHWNLRDVTDEAELITSELVGNAVKATGIADHEPKSWEIQPWHVIGVQLRIIDTDLFIEVWDNDRTAPVMRKPSLDEEGGRGLLLVEAMSKKWDIYRPQVGGKVVWAQLPLSRGARLTPGLPLLPRRVVGATQPPEGIVTRMADAALLQRALDGFRALDDEPQSLNSSTYRTPAEGS
ncbi:ATP-binding protein [Streptomyces sp. NBC_01373]|uniref:ATP-binding protein n=1 Tax=Streptomyces sp. NBC_01373 TaxID=2903843 RepID=UPI002252DC4D|nr:ATP-binding protein [Streptomyces sp. NBC_01373]MCX4699018.1 ATP-binding protein [Streptomyces sp. NBC_01373]